MMSSNVKVLKYSLINIGWIGDVAPCADISNIGAGNEGGG